MQTEETNKSHRGKFLIIDNNPKLKDVLSKHLMNLGYCHEFVNNKGEAINRLKDEDFDAIILGHKFLSTQDGKRKIINEVSRYPFITNQ